MGGRNEQNSIQDACGAAAVVTIRHLCNAHYKFNEPPAGTSANNECDMNADTCCLGRNFIIF